MNQIPILDAGAQLYAAIGRVCDELGVEPVFYPIDVDPEELKPYPAFIISGGGAGVYEEDAPKLHPAALNFGKHVLGICYGMHLLNHMSGGEVKPLAEKEYGKTYIISSEADSVLFSGLDERQRVLMSHGDSIATLAAGFRVAAKSDAGLISAIEDAERGLYGVQFHPEARPISKHGKEVMANFLKAAGYELSKPKPIDQLIGDIEEYISETMPGSEERVLFGLSGGIDSTVAALMAEKVLGHERCTGVLIDTGGMRKGEVDWVVQNLSKYLKMKIEVIDAADEFLNASGYKDDNGKLVETKKLCEETDAAHKRGIFSRVYQEVFARYMEENGFDEETDYLGQGTLRPDIIESAAKRVSRNAKKIKQHHNVFDRFTKLEPLSHLHKDQVREIAVKLGLPPEIAYRQPYPGPGLYIRTLCTRYPFMDERFEETYERVKELAEKECVHAMLLPIRTVGIQGDDRTYAYSALLHGNHDWEIMFDLADVIPRRIHNVNRVFRLLNHEIPDKNPTEIIIPTFANKVNLDLLREADAIVNFLLQQQGIDSRQIAQSPVNLLPLDFGRGRTIGLRHAITHDFYTLLPAMPSQDPSKEEEPTECIDADLIDIATERILEISGIGSVVYDCSSKPPSTTELE